MKNIVKSYMCKYDIKPHLKRAIEQKRQLERLRYNYVLNFAVTESWKESRSYSRNKHLGKCSWK